MPKTEIDTLIGELKKGPVRVPREKNKLKLSPEDIVKAREARKLGATYQAIGDALGVSDYTAFCAVKGQKAYKEVEK